VAERVYGRSLAGTCEVARRSVAVMGFAGRSLPGWLGTQAVRTCCPRFPLRGNLAGSGKWQDRAGRSCRTCPPARQGIFGGGAKDGGADRICRGWPRVAERMAEYGVTWFEEPVSSQDLAWLAAVRRQVRPDVAAGEYSWSLADSARLIAAGAVDCLQLDVTRCGGISEFLRGAALAGAHSMQVPPTARPTCTRTSARQCRICGISSTSMTTSASSGCCSTEPSIPTAGSLPLIPASPVSAHSLEQRTQSGTGGREASRLAEQAGPSGAGG
jgi:Enolase C-terminal domain-like